MHLLAHPRKKKGKKYTYYSIAESYREDGKNKKRILLRLGRLSSLQVQQIRNVLKVTQSPDIFVATIEDILLEDHWAYLDVAVLNHLWDNWDLSKPFPASKNKNISTANIAKILTFNRCIDPGSKLYAVEWFKETTCDHLLGIVNKRDCVNDSRIYRELKLIEESKEDIEQHLYKTLKERNKDSFRIVFYDLTDSYFEGRKCKLARPGRTKDYGFRSRKIVLSLLVNSEGYPFSWDILDGDTVDVNTLKERSDYCEKRFGISDITWVFDRGMVSDENLNYLNEKGWKYITALDKNQIPNVPCVDLSWFKDLDIENVKKRLIDMGFRRYDECLYYRDLGDSERKRYIIGFNPELFVDERKNREQRIEKGVKYLERENIKLSNAKRNRDGRVTDRRINETLKKLGARKYLDYHLEPIQLKIVKRKKPVKSFRIVYRKKDKVIKRAEKLDGLCMIVTNHLQEEHNKGEKKRFDAERVISSYRDKYRVEEAFKMVKSFIKFQPVYVYKDEHVRAHYTICSLAYLLDMTITNMLRKSRIDEVSSVEKAYKILGKCRIGEIKVKNSRHGGKKITTPTNLQKKLLDALGCRHLISGEYLKSIGIGKM